MLAPHPGAPIFRYPMIYGPNNARPHEWSIVRRVRDRRPHMILPHGGLQIHTRCAARNAAAFLLAAVDEPDVAAAHVYTCGDPTSWSMREWAESVDTLMGAGFTVNNPNAVTACGCGSSFRTADDAGPARSCAH